MEDICCVCLKATENLMKIYKADENEKTYYDKLQSFVPNLGWSKKFSICVGCVLKLNVAFDFYTVCIESETARKDNLPLIDFYVKSEGESASLCDFTCDICNKEFKTSKALKSHITKIHKKPKIESVEETLNIVIERDDENDTKQDVKSATEEKIEPVKDEDSIQDVFKDLSELDSPDNCDDFDSDFEVETKKKETKERKKKDCVIKEKKEKRSRMKIKLPVKCEFCGKEFNRKQHLLAHIRCIHTFEKPYHCDQCDAKFSLSHSLLVHKRRHNDDRRYVCTYCGKKFLCSTDLVHHNKIHLNKREYKCEPCNKSFNTISVLQIHKKCVHTDPSFWKHICSFCDRRFPIKSSLTAHIRRHTGEKNFSCTICGKSFYDKKMVENHYRSHTDERLFKCHLCEKDYKDRGGLNLHLKKVHDVGNATIPPPPPKKFGCHLCPKAFSSRGKLQKHICTHTGEKMFNCHMCDKKFNDSWYKKVHLQRIHNVTLSDEELKNIIKVEIQNNAPQAMMQNNHIQAGASPLEPLKNVKIEIQNNGPQAMMHNSHIQASSSPLQPLILQHHSPMQHQNNMQPNSMQHMGLQPLQPMMQQSHPSPYN